MSELALVLGADEGYARGLAVAMHSALARLSPNVDVDVHLLDTGLSQQTRSRLESIAGSARPAAGVTWVPISREALAVRGSAWLSDDAVYHARVLIPELLPAGTARVVYVDSDVLVVDDLYELFATNLGGAAVGAVRDFVITSTDHELSGVRERSNPRPYFNSGVLVIDVERWRGLGLTDQVLEYAASGSAALPFPEQDALNAVVEKWHELDYRWNVNNLIFDPIGPSPPDPFVEELRARRHELYDHAGILHFVRKPWNRFSRAPGATAWVQALLRSGWHPPQEAAVWLAQYMLKGARYSLGTRRAQLTNRPSRRAPDGAARW